MKEKEFDFLVKDTLNTIENVLIIKGKEYRRNNDPLHNFNIGTGITNTTREEVIDSFMLKHYISYRDMLNDIKDNKLPTEEYIDEKVVDMINYLLLFKASVVDKIRNKELLKKEISEKERK